MSLSDVYGKLTERCLGRRDRVANNVNVTNRGFEYMCQYLALTNNNSSNSGWTVPSVIGWGTANGSNATSVLLPAGGPVQSFPANISTAGTGQWNDVGPFNEQATTEARVTGTPSVTGNTAAGSFSTYQLTGTMTAAAGEAIGESFLVFSTTKPAASSVATGNMTNVQTSFTTGTVLASGLAAPYFIQIDNEVLQVSATASSNIYTISRAQNGSTAAAHNQNAGVTLGNIPGAGNNNPNHGDMSAHAGFVALTLNSGDSIAFTWQVNVTS
jgi:hypothetical protein